MPLVPIRPGNEKRMRGAVTPAQSPGARLPYAPPTRERRKIARVPAVECSTDPDDGDRRCPAPATPSREGHCLERPRPGAGHRRPRRERRRAWARVSGGGGAIGSNVVDELVLAGAKEVVVLDNFVRGRRENLAWAQAN